MDQFAARQRHKCHAASPQNDLKKLASRGGTSGAGGAGGTSGGSGGTSGGTSATSKLCGGGRRVARWHGRGHGQCRDRLHLAHRAGFTRIAACATMLSHTLVRL